MDIIFMILIGFPVLSLLTGVLGFYLVKNIFVTPLIIFVTAIFATYAFFNETFWIWVWIYTFLSLGSGMFTKVISKRKG
jgi:hypothetical protein